MAVPVRLLSSPLPRHVAFIARGFSEFARERNASLSDAYARSFTVLRDLALTAFRLDIPVVTVVLLPAGVPQPILQEIVPFLASGIEALSSWDEVGARRVKLTVLGRWYDLPGGLVESVKRAMDSTKEHDAFFLNICLQYSGQEEIVDAFRVLARQVQSGKLDPDAVDRDAVKERLATSYFPPPELLIKTGLRHSLQDALLWDCAFADLRFVDVPFPELSRDDLAKALEWWQSQQPVR